RRENRWRWRWRGCARPPPAGPWCPWRRSSRCRSGGPSLASCVTWGSGSAQVHQGLQDLVLRLDGLRVGLVVALLDDHLHQLAGEFDVGVLDHAGGDHATHALARLYRRGEPRLERRFPVVVAERAQRVGVAEGLDGDLGEIDGLPVGVATGDDAVAADRHTGQFAAGVAVLGELVDQVGTTDL